VLPAPFQLLFNYPNGIDPSRFGFDPLPMTGSDVYTSTRELSCPTADKSPLPAIVRITEVGHKKTFRIVASSLPPFTSLVCGYESGELHLRTYVKGIPFVHGIRAGSIVQISPAVHSDLIVSVDNAWTNRVFAPAALAPAWGHVGIVASPRDQEDGINLRVRVRPTPRLSECIDELVLIQAQPEPVNFSFGVLERSIPEWFVGFPKGSVQWGLDGSVCNSDAYKLPPFDAPFVYNLDHPDYILIFLSEGNQQRLLQHGSSANTTSPFCKLVLFPTVREERMLPRDSTLLSGTLFTQFDIRFTNPDGTPYHFHGANFSFSLNFVRVG
jgi:hypothetical protein